MENFCFMGTNRYPRKNFVIMKKKTSFLWRNSVFIDNFVVMENFVTLEKQRFYK